MMFENASNIDNVQELVLYTNNVTDGLFTYMLIIAFWLVIYLGLTAYRKDAAALSASFAIFVLASVMVAFGVVGLGVLMLATAMLIISFILFQITNG